MGDRKKFLSDRLRQNWVGFFVAVLCYLVIQLFTFRQAEVCRQTLKHAVYALLRVQVPHVQFIYACFVYKLQTPIPRHRNDHHRTRVCDRSAVIDTIPGSGRDCE